jgi:hypothetical protein
MTYILLLRNASGIHIYYQYYLALPVTFGLVLILDMIADKQDAIKRNRVWVLSLSLLFVFIAGYTVYQYDEFFSHMVGDVSDIQLLKTCTPGSCTYIQLSVTSPIDGARFLKRMPTVIKSRYCRC